MDASRPGYLLFAARYGDRDALVVCDLKRAKMAGRYQFEPATWAGTAHITSVETSPRGT